MIGLPAACSARLKTPDEPNKSFANGLVQKKLPMVQYEYSYSYSYRRNNERGTLFLGLGRVSILQHALFRFSNRFIGRTSQSFGATHPFEKKYAGFQIGCSTWEPTRA